MRFQKQFRDQYMSDYAYGNSRGCTSVRRRIDVSLDINGPLHLSAAARRAQVVNLRYGPGMVISFTTPTSIASRHDLQPTVDVILSDHHTTKNQVAVHGGSEPGKPTNGFPLLSCHLLYIADRFIAGIAVEQGIRVPTP